MVKKVKISGKGAKHTLAVDILGTVYNIPLARSMTYKELKSLKDEESVHDFFAKYIDPEILDNLTMDEYSQIMNAWSGANEEYEGTSLGE